ncbi:MAG: Undecaprenyl-phosphate mannosyltransferase [Candidatus Omnitrophica bacterium]|nr:Undecaprenyl-phosphate mannosyltransferase [Candidatus Omnitrophota bacterium]
MIHGLKVLAVPVAYNEEKKIRRVFERFREVAGVDRVLLLDDASTDSTPQVAREFGYEVLTQPRRSGVGAAIRRAIHYGREHGFDVLVVLAGNDKDRPVEIPRLVRPIAEQGADFVQGSRYLPGGDYGNMPIYRQLSTRWVHPILLSWAAGQRITDSTNGFRALRLSCFDDKRIDIEQDWLDRYELEPYLYFKFIKLGYRVREVPVTKIYPPKELGYTKMRPITGWWSILRPIFLLGLGIRK